jgi:hypothetical protein
VFAPAWSGRTAEEDPGRVDGGIYVSGSGTLTVKPSVPFG